MSDFGYKIGSSVLRAFQRLPLGFHYRVGRFLSWMLGDVLRYRRDVIMVNLARSFPDKKYHELEQICKDSYKSMGEIFAEAMFFGGCRNRPGKLHDSHLAEIVDTDGLFDRLKERSVMVLNTHYGNWELTGGCFEFFYKPPYMADNMSYDDVCIVYKEFTSKFWDRFIGENRCAIKPDFKGYIESRTVLRYAIEHKNERKFYIFPTDQYPYGSASCDIPSFMHQPTKVMTGGIALAHKFGMAVYFMCIDRKRRGRYEISFRSICPDASRMEVSDIIAEYYRRLEVAIESQPANYLWSHKRWK
ncbi:MAG: lysophospholipid acyltransferase family protein [Bacteroidales bacterium]|nr:lysophospholipid acyltransferase family protein [Bacteroidales bacterium]